MKNYIVPIPINHLSINELLNMHWTERKKWVDKYKSNVGLFLNLAKIPQIQFNYAKILIEIYFKINRRRDISNYDCKYLIDALVDMSILLDDNKKVIPKRPEIKIISPAEKDETILYLELKIR